MYNFEDCRGFQHDKIYNILPIYLGQAAFRLQFSIYTTQMDSRKSRPAFPKGQLSSAHKLLHPRLQVKFNVPVPRGCKYN